MIDEAQRAGLKDRLVAEQARLKGEIDTMTGRVQNQFWEDETDAVDQHPGDDGTELFEREKDLTIVGTLQAQLREVEAALQKFEDGTYGICEMCGKPIPEKRLEAYPAATHDVDCQSKLERMGGQHAVTGA